MRSFIFSGYIHLQLYCPILTKHTFNIEYMLCCDRCDTVVGLLALDVLAMEFFPWTPSNLQFQLSVSIFYYKTVLSIRNIQASQHTCVFQSLTARPQTAGYFITMSPALTMGSSKLRFKLRLTYHLQKLSMKRAKESG